MRASNTARLAGVASLTLGFVALMGCDYSGDFLFPEAVTDVRPVIDLGTIEPALVTSMQDAADAAVYAQVAATGDARYSGATATFFGIGGDVCVWVDPEFVTWSASVATRGVNRRYAYPDNLEDDGDLDLEVGLQIYYSGTPDVEIGDFAIRYEDALGNPVAIALNECVIPAPLDQVSVGGHPGRGAPEYCTISDTQPGVPYVVKMQTWSTPIDDDRMSFGLLIMQGSCEDLRNTNGALGVTNDTAMQECVIPGETIDNSMAGSEGPWVGADNVPTRAGARSFEEAFCDVGERLSVLCEEEAEEKDCKVEACFCGDNTNRPEGGVF